MVALSCWALTAHAVRISDVPTDALWSCETYAGTTTYLSSVFRATSTPDQVQNAFAQVLAQKYGYNGRVDCPMAYASQTPIEKLQSDQKSRVAQLRGAGRTVVETGWAFGAATASVPYFCYSSVTVTQAGHATALFIMTDTFRVTGSDRLAIVESWERHVRGLHPGFPPSSSDCTSVPPDGDAAKALRQNAIAQHHIDGMQVVAEAWAYTGQVPAPDNRIGYFCEAASIPKKTIYLSPLEVAGAGFDQTAASHAWGTYVVQTPGLGQAYAQAACESGPLAAQQQVRAARIEQQHSMAGGVVHEIDWRYGGGDTPAATAAAPATSPAATTPPGAADDRMGYFCVAQSKDHKTLYQSRIEVADGAFSEGAASQAWSSYVATKFGLDPGYAHAACAGGPISRQRAMREQSRQSVAGLQVIDVDWAFASSHASPPPTGTAAAPVAAAGAPTAPAAPNVASAAPSTSTNTAPHVAPALASTTQTPAPGAPAGPMSHSNAPQAAPPHAPHAKNPWVCQADAYTGSKRTHYISEAFDSDEATQQLTPAWRAHLVSAYQLPGQVVAHCGRLPQASQDAIEASLAKNQNVPLVHDQWQP